MESQLHLSKLFGNASQNNCFETIAPWQMQNKTKGMWVEGKVEFMLLLNISDIHQNNLFA